MRALDMPKLLHGAVESSFPGERQRNLWRIDWLSEWQKSHWLKGALALILDDKYSARLCGYRLTYDQEYGLIYEKEDRADD
jgi:hypothetical protein